MEMILTTRTWNVFHLIVLTLLSAALYFGWMFASDSFATTSISRTVAMVWGSPIFYLVQLLNVGWLTAYEVGSRLFTQGLGPEHNIELIGKALKRPDCRVDADEVVRALSKKRSGKTTPNLK